MSRGASCAATCRSAAFVDAARRLPERATTHVIAWRAPHPRFAHLLPASGEKALLHLQTPRREFPRHRSARKTLVGIPRPASAGRGGPTAGGGARSLCRLLHLQSP